MRKVKIVFAAILAALMLAFVPGSAQAQSEITFKFKSNYQYKVQVAFYSADRKGHVWPGGGKAYALDDSQVHNIKIACLGGEKVCYGGWVTGNSKLYWGVGNNNTQRCEKCCFACNGGQTPVITLE
jgi:hypothetical protein